MVTRNLRLMLIISLLCTVNPSMHGMNRDAVVASKSNLKIVMGGMVLIFGSIFMLYYSQESPIGLDCAQVALDLSWCNNKYTHPLAREAFCMGEMPGDEETFRKHPYLISGCIQALFDYCKCYYNKP